MVPDAPEQNPGTLYIVSTPIGNADDISARALQVLRGADMIVCEERTEGERLLKRHCRRVSSRFISYWDDVPPDGLFIAWTAER